MKNLTSKSSWSRAAQCFAVLLLASCSLAAADSPREQAIKIVAQVQRADYEGDRAALKRLYGDLAPFTESKDFASRVRYWRGFAMWRRAINGFNDSADPKELEDDLNQAIAEFNVAIEKDPAFVDAKIAAASSLGYLMFMNHGDQAKIQQLMSQSSPLLKSAMAADPDNPRLLWVLGPIRWSTPPERGGGQDKAIDGYKRGLESIRNRKNPNPDPLEPAWGEPELLMNLAWSNLNLAKPDLVAAESYARSALAIVPYWHYVRDILLKQIEAAKSKHN